MHFECIHTLPCCIFLEPLWSPSANLLSCFLFGNKLSSVSAIHMHVL